METKQDKNIIEKNPEVEEMLERQPSIAITWGIPVMAILFVILVVLGFVIRYPDVIQARVSITTNPPPIDVFSRSEGELDTLFISEEQLVQSGDLLAVIKSTVKHKDVLEFKNTLELIRNNMLGSSIQMDSIYRPPLLSGEMESASAEFFRKLRQLGFFIKNNRYRDIIQRMEDQLGNYGEMSRSAANQQKLFQKDVDIAKKFYTIDSLLFQNKVISQTELETSRRNYLTKLYQYENTAATMGNTNVQMLKQEQLLLETLQQYEDKQREAELDAEETWKKLMGKIQEWEQKYLVRAQTPGRVSFIKQWGIKQFVHADEKLFSVLPEGGTMEGLTYLPPQGAGKIQKGQKVMIELDDYPYEEFGRVEGRVEILSGILTDNGYKITVALPAGLNTNYNKTLTFKQQMTGTAVIITEDISFLGRIFNKFRKVMKDNA